MKYIIDEEIAKKHGLSVAELMLLAVIQQCSQPSQLIASLTEKECLVEVGDHYHVTQHWADEMASVLLESDESVPSQDRVLTLVQKMKEYFPKGLKVGSAAWRGNDRELTLRMKKFFKLYGNKWSDEQILAATKEYVESFNGDYRFMQILKYFILKSKKIEGEEGNYIEDVSALASFLEKQGQGEENTSNWTQTVL
jgi:hypothetical protein